MIERLVRASVAHRKGVIGIWVLLAFGFLALALRLELDALPDVTSNQVQVLTRAPGLTPAEVELRVTRPLEGMKVAIDPCLRGGVCQAFSNKESLDRH